MFDKKTGYVAYVFTTSLSSETIEWIAENLPEVRQIIPADTDMVVKVNPFTGEHGLVHISESHEEDF